MHKSDDENRRLAKTEMQKDNDTKLVKEELEPGQMLMKKVEALGSEMCSALGVLC